MAASDQHNNNNDNSNNSNDENSSKTENKTETTTTSTKNPNDRFNSEAASWDSNVDVQRASAYALAAILERFPQLRQAKEAGTVSTEGLDVLELGCGTGILSLLVAPYVRHITAIDASHGMIDVLRQKLSTTADNNSNNAASNIEPLNVMLTDPEDAQLPDPRVGGAGRRKYDLIISHLVLHHIPDLKSVIKTLHGCLKPGTGWLALTDFEDFGPQARRFHPESKMGGVERHGIAKTDMESMLKEEGLEDVKVEVAFELEKQVERWAGEWSGAAEGKKPAAADGEFMKFPFLICMGKRAEGM